MVGDSWVPIGEGKRASEETVAKCQQQFGQDWLTFRTENGVKQAKLKTFAEIEAKFSEPGKFLFIQNEEISTGFDDRAVHLNALNLAAAIAPKVGTSVADTIALNLTKAKEQALGLERRMLLQVNHPNFACFDIAAEDLAASPAKFFEVCNGHPGVRNLGDANHPSVEKIWDVANTIRIAKMKASPLFAIGSDDTHNYHKAGPGVASPGRAWIMVRAKELSAPAIVEAADRGDFYASTGVVLKDIAYDAPKRTLKVDIAAEPNVAYTIEFIGTLEDADPARLPVEVGGNPNRPAIQYSPEIGKVLSRVEGPSATYQLTGKELYVRPVVRSNKPVANPSRAGAKNQEAWGQPVGWEK
jgi:hypothetical protein